MSRGRVLPVPKDFRVLVGKTDANQTTRNAHEITAELDVMKGS